MGLPSTTGGRSPALRKPLLREPGVELPVCFAKVSVSYFGDGWGVAREVTPQIDHDREVVGV